MLTFRDTDKKFESNENLLKTITNKNSNVDLADSSAIKLEYEIAKEIWYDEKALGNESARQKSSITLLQSPAIMSGSLNIKSFSQTKKNKNLIFIFQSKWTLW